MAFEVNGRFFFDKTGWLHRQMGFVAAVEPQQFLLKLAPSGVAPKTRSTGFTPEQILWYVIARDAFSCVEMLIHRFCRRIKSAAWHCSGCLPLC